jgi:formylglycine-generating enzyme required for sulfatase activity
MAYCTWLSKMTGKAITLPSEAQWEKAAHGREDQREFPWGEEWKEGYCNTDELGLNDTTPVGIFPEGASPYGCLDMAGNVWEWTISLYGPYTKAEIKLQFGYPYEPEDGRENMQTGDDMSRVVRGGSFSRNRDDARCVVRHVPQPANLWSRSGLRVVVSPISPASAP